MSKININVKLFIVLMPVLMLVNCNSDNNDGYYNIPYVYVNYTINLDLPSYSNLVNIGGYVVIGNQGYKGIIVFHDGFDQFTAIERACTYQPLDACSIVTVDNSGTFIRCGHYETSDWIGCCNSKFTMDGTIVLEGPAKYPLKHYQVIKTGNSLLITN